MIARTRPPAWFWVVGALALLWGVMGVGGFFVDRMTTPAQLAAMSAYDQKLYATRPGWSVWAYGIATVAGLLGAILLLARRRAARPVWMVSLIFVVLLFGYILGFTDIIAVKGFANSAGFPIAIALIGAAEIWFAGLAIRRGWIE